jgi:hypothetical protein
MIALLISEANKKHPQRIQPEILKLLQKVSIQVASKAIEGITFDADWWYNHGHHKYTTRLPSLSFIYLSPLIFT